MARMVTPRSRGIPIRRVVKGVPNGRHSAKLRGVPMLGVMEGAEQPNGPDNPKRCRDRGGGGRD